MQIFKIWFLRSLFINQQILDELSPQIFEKINIIVDEIKSSLHSYSKAAIIALHLEFARIYIYFNNIQISKTDVQKATDLSGVEISLSGMYILKKKKFVNYYCIFDFLPYITRYFV